MLLWKLTTYHVADNRTITNIFVRCYKDSKTIPPWGRTGASLYSCLARYNRTRERGCDGNDGDEKHTKSTTNNIKQGVLKAQFYHSFLLASAK